MMKKKSGFTLIELSIVLVIVGFLVGGVLVGQELVQAAKNRGAISEMQQIEVAANTFRVKFDGKPGDFNKAASLGLGENGNGDKLLNITFIGTTDYAGIRHTVNTSTPYVRALDEGQLFWVHMHAAGLTNESISRYTGYVAPGDPAGYFVPFKNGKGKTFLHPFSWGGKTYIQTGLGYILGNNSSRFPYPSVSGPSMRSITQKMGYDYIRHTNCPNHFNSCSFPLALLADQRVSASGVGGAIPGTDGKIYISPEHSSGGTVPCANATDYRDDGECHMLWQID